MEIERNGKIIIIELYCSNGGNLLAYKRSDTKIANGYIYNIYSRRTDCLRSWDDFSNLKYHKKLKIYKHPDGINFYFKINNTRMFVSTSEVKANKQEEDE